MSHLFSHAPFADFGPAALHGDVCPPQIQQIHGSRTSVLRSALREQCPRQPGIYGMVDLHGELVYVGKAKNLRARLLTYFRPRSRDPKAGRIVSQARSIVWENCPDEFAALHRELELIRRWRPRCNIQGKPHSWQHTFICLGRGTAPYVFLARRPLARVLANFGPILAGGKARDAVRRLNDWFLLRDCPQAQEMHFAGQAHLFPGDLAAGCLRHDLGTCLGPCTAACSQAAYTTKVRAARAFLSGANLAPLADLEAAMKEAAAQQLFERAAAMRDKLESLAWLHSQLDRMRQAEAMGTAIYPVAGHDGIMRWYVLHGGRAVAVAVALAKDQASLQALARERTRAAKPADRIAGVLLLASWFRRHPKEQERLVPM